MSDGVYTASENFNMVDVNGYPIGITWDGAYLRVLDSEDDKVYAYSSTGTYVQSASFDLDPANADASGITWDGAYLRVVDSIDDKVYAYTSDGVYTASKGFNLDGDNVDPRGITWDGAYLRVVDTREDKVYAYEGAPPGPLTNFGLSDDADYEGAFSTTVVSHGAWKCLSSSGGESFTINNAALTLHGFCVQKTSGGGLEVEVHLPESSSYADLTRMADATGSWSFFKVGVLTAAAPRIYDDTATDTGALAFTEEVGGLEPSDRLGFPTMAKAVTDDDCDETDGAGFQCNLVYLAALGSTVDDVGVLLLSLTDENNVEFADTPTVPESLTVSRDSGYTDATVNWVLYDAVTVYEIYRVTAVRVDVADASRIEYGDPVTFGFNGTQAGIDEYQDSTVEAHRTYQYRIRARGADGASWSGWSEYVFSGARPEVDLQAPSNLELDRGASSVVASWTAPAGSFDNFTLQRQELVVVEGSTFFANVVTLGAGAWLSGDSTMYTDIHIIPSLTYEYRVAAVLDDLVGSYSDWFRVAPPNTSLGDAPAGLRMLDDGRRRFDERREFWVGWDEVAGADDYEVQVQTYDPDTGGRRVEKYVVTDNSYFQTSFGRAGVRVRGRQFATSAASICSRSADNRCLTGWTGWLDARFIPTITIEEPPAVDVSAAASTVTLRQDLEEVIDAALEPAGTTVNAGLLIQLGVLVVALVVGALSIALSWRRGMVPLGVGMAAAISILILFVGYRLFETPLAWPIAAQSLVAVAGLFAIVRQTGVFKKLSQNPFGGVQSPDTSGSGPDESGGDVPPVAKSP